MWEDVPGGRDMVTPRGRDDDDDELEFIVLVGGGGGMRWMDGRGGA